MNSSLIHSLIQPTFNAAAAPLVKRASKQIHGCSLVFFSLSAVLPSRAKEGKIANLASCVCIVEGSNEYQRGNSISPNNQPAVFNSKWTHNDVCMRERELGFSFHSQKAPPEVRPKPCHNSLKPVFIKLNAKGAVFCLISVTESRCHCNATIDSNFSFEPK